MDQTLYSIKDVKAGHHLPPFVSFNDLTAIRQFNTAINTEGHEFNVHPRDYQLWRIAKFESGQAVISENEPSVIAEGINEVNRPEWDGEAALTQLMPQGGK